MQFIAECYKAHKLINKIVYVCLSVYLIQFLIAQEIWDKVVFKDPFSTKLFPRKIWLKKCVIKLLMLFYLHENLSRIDLLQKVIKKLKDDIFSNDNIIFVNEDSNHVTFFGGEMSILSVDLDKINLDMLIMMKMILKLLFMSDLWLGLININNANHVKRYKQRIKVSEYP